jgi:hypothetical protein
MVEFALPAEGLFGGFAVIELKVSVAAAEPFEEFIAHVAVIAPKEAWLSSWDRVEQKDARLGLAHHLFDRAIVQQERPSNTRSLLESVLLNYKRSGLGRANLFGFARGIVSVIIYKVGMWRSLVAHTLGVRGVAGSNPAIPTKSHQDRGQQGQRQDRDHRHPQDRRRRR